jgi:hypothetical protein
LRARQSELAFAVAKLSQSNVLHHAFAVSSIFEFIQQRLCLISAQFRLCWCAEERFHRLGCAAPLVALENSVGVDRPEFGCDMGAVNVGRDEAE